jgi:hypothetical protein
MAIITDPDSLDRYQVLVDYVNQKIGIKPIDSASPKVDLKINGVTGGSGSNVFSGVDFGGSGVTAGDILTILEGGDINHWVVASTLGTTGVTVVGNFASGESNLSYAVMPAIGGTTTDGVTLQAVYSFLKEEWRTQASDMPDLIKHTFPLESITREQFEIGGTTHEDWDWRDDTTRNLLRTGGWAQISSAGVTQSQYAGIITLGSVDADAQVYYLQSDGGTPTNFVLTGPVNQAIKVYQLAGDDHRTYLKLFVRKKGRTYAQSEIADIGVTTIETIVNRFPLAHTTDPAILETDGDLIGTTPYQSVVRVDYSATGGIVGSSEAATVQKTFNFHDGTATFDVDGLVAGDTVFIQDASNTGRFEIVAVVGANDLTLLQEPSMDIVGVTGIAYETFTRVRSAQKTDGSAKDVSTTGGYFTSATSTFTTNSVAQNDLLVISTGNNSVVGVYKVDAVTSETGLRIDTTDQAFPDASIGSLTFTVYRPGMFLQYKNVAATTVGPSASIDFVDSNPDTIVRNAGSFIADGYVHGGAVTVTLATTAANNASFIIDTVSTGTLTLISEEVLSAYADDAAAVLNGDLGFVRTMNAVDYPFSWRVFGNGGSLGEIYQWIQKELRRTTDIDMGEITSRGDITDLLMTYSSPTAVTLNMFIDDLSSADLNNVTKKDLTGVSRNFAFIAGVVVNLNTNILNSSSAKVVIFFTNDDAGDNTGRDFGTDGAIIVNDQYSVPMQAVNPATTPLSYEYDYDNNSQRGTAAKGTNAPVTVVCIGTDSAQYVQTVGTIQRVSTNVFSLVAAVERNYSNV